MASDLKDSLGDAGVKAVLEGRYSLLLGAGASFGAKSKDGRPLPMGDGYGKELVAKYSLSISAGTSLQHVWDAACHRAGSEQALREESLVPRFNECTPAEYQRHFAEFAWKRIYTVNVDDSLVGAYATTKSRLQNLIEVHYEDQYSDATPTDDAVQLVYLHGSAALKSQRVIFSPPAYADAVTGQKTWFHVFADSFLSEPFFVIGASLREADFEAYFAQKRRFPNPLAPPSLYISPSIDDAVKAICHRLELVPVALSGEAFLSELASLVGHRERLSVRFARSLQPLTLLRAFDNLPAIAAVGEQFLLLSRDVAKWPTAPRGREAFYEGFDANWDDIRMSNDVALKFEADIAQDIRGYLDSVSTSSPRVLIISDSAGTGKTTAAMRIAATFALEGRGVLYLVGTERFKDDALLAALEKEKSPILVVIDRMVAHSLQVTRFLSAYPKGGPRCFILGTERKGHEFTLRERLGDFKPEFREIPKLSKAEAEDLARKLRSVAKLGKLAGKSDTELAELFTATKGSAWAGQLLVILLEITQERRLIDRLAEEWNSLSEQGRRFYGAICIAAACGYPIRSARAYATLSVGSAAAFAQEVVAGPLRGLIQWEFEGGDYYIKPKHRVLAEEIVRHCMTSDEVFEISRAVALALAPYVNRRTIMSGSSDARLMRELMDEDGFVIPRFHHRAEEWFESLQPSCEWNSRFWEQRALSAMRAGKRKRARDFAETGIGIERHPQPLTTYARVLMDSAENDAAAMEEQRREFFIEALSLLDEAIDEANRQRRNDVHPYNLLLITAVRVSHRLYNHIVDSLRDAVRRHAPHAEKFLMYDAEIRQALVRLRKASVI